MFESLQNSPSKPHDLVSSEQSETETFLYNRWVLNSACVATMTVRTFNWNTLLTLANSFYYTKLGYEYNIQQNSLYKSGNFVFLWFI